MIIKCEHYKQYFDSDYEENTHIMYLNELLSLLPDKTDNNFIYIFDRNKSFLDSIKCYSSLNSGFAAQYSYDRFHEEFITTYFKNSTNNSKRFIKDFKKYRDNAISIADNICNNINRYYSNTIRRIHISYIYEVISYLEFTKNISRAQYKSVTAFALKLEEVTTIKFRDYNVPYYYSIVNEYLPNCKSFKELDKELFANINSYEMLYNIKEVFKKHIASQYKRLCNNIFDSLCMVIFMEFTTIDDKKILVVFNHSNLLCRIVKESKFVITSNDFNYEYKHNDNAIAVEYRDNLDDNAITVEYRDNLDDFVIEARYFYNDSNHNIHNLIKCFDYNFVDNEFKSYIWDANCNNKKRS